jgi:hypothetical protein
MLMASLVGLLGHLSKVITSPEQVIKLLNTNPKQENKEKENNKWQEQLA